ncbi:MAG: hypothetical protein Q8Q49_03235 [bacterium]|nr:hypothetical protein [bacterium]
MKLLTLTLPGTDGEPVTIQAPPGLPTGGFIESGLGNTILNNLVGAVSVIGVLLALFYLIWGGVSWTISGGDKEKIAAARKKIIYAIIGMVIIFLALFIVNLILTFFGQTSSPLLTK